MVIKAHLNSEVVFFFREVFTVSDNSYCVYTQNIIKSPREGDQWQIADLSPEEVKGAGREREVGNAKLHVCPYTLVKFFNNQLLICVVALTFSSS